MSTSWLENSFWISIRLTAEPSAASFSETNVIAVLIDVSVAAAPELVFRTLVLMASVVESICCALTVITLPSTVLNTVRFVALWVIRLTPLNSALATMVENWSRRETKSLWSAVRDAESRPDWLACTTLAFISINRSAIALPAEIATLAVDSPVANAALTAWMPAISPRMFWAIANVAASSFGPLILRPVVMRNWVISRALVVLFRF